MARAWAARSEAWPIRRAGPAAAAGSLALVPAAIHAAAPQGTDEAALAAIGARQKDMVARGDIEGPGRLAAPGLRISAPTGRVPGRGRFLAMMRSGAIGAEAFERRRERRHRG